MGIKKIRRRMCFKCRMVVFNIKFCVFKTDEMSEYVKNLQLLIEQTYEENGRQRVVLIGHSMGNLYILYMLNHLPQSWKDQYIKSFISLAAPWGGAVKTIRLMTSGWRIFRSVCYVVCYSAIKKLIYNFKIILITFHLR